MRERRLAGAEEQLKQQHAQKLSELQLLQRRLREDSRHATEVEKQRRAEVEERLARAEDSRDRYKKRLEEVESDFDRFRHANRKVSRHTSKHAHIQTHTHTSIQGGYSETGATLPPPF